MTADPAEGKPAPAVLLPWFEDHFRRLQDLHRQGRLGHAWLISGHAGTGKLQFAASLARLLLCKNADAPCRHCHDCHLFDVGNHPDYCLIRPEKQLIRIEQVRDAIEFAQGTSRNGGMKVLLIEPAEAMNQNAANALLKLLEEPPPRTVLLLVSHQSGMLPATIRSRCQQLRLSLPSTEVAIGWLAEQNINGSPELALRRAGGAPLRALAQADGDWQSARQQVLDCVQQLVQGRMAPVEAAKKCDKLPIAASIELLMACVADLCANLQAARPLGDPDVAALGDRLQLKRQPLAYGRLLQRLYAELQQARNAATASNNANQQLIMESLFARWQQLGQRSRARPTP